MSWRRKAGYLILIAPLHHLLSIIAALPAMLLAPPDILIQMILLVPCYAVALWWVVPAFQRAMGLNSPTSRIVISKVQVLIAGFTAIGSAIVVIACHVWLIRTL